MQQIGLYIRREEKPLYTPIVTPSASEVSASQRGDTCCPGNPQAALLLFPSWSGSNFSRCFCCLSLLNSINICTHVSYTFKRHDAKTTTPTTTTTLVNMCTIHQQQQHNNNDNTKHTANYSHTGIDPLAPRTLVCLSKCFGCVCVVCVFGVCVCVVPRLGLD